jgi:glyoxylase-like metal-dependent hydrolase (beta-lactamase superfamily II)
VVCDAHHNRAKVYVSFQIKFLGEGGTGGSPLFLKRGFPPAFPTGDSPGTQWVMMIEHKPESSGGEVTLSPCEADGWRLGTTLSLPDQPGELAALAGLVAKHEANMTCFAYNRSEHPGLVRVAATCVSASRAGALTDAFMEAGYLTPSKEATDEASEEATLLDPEALLRVKISLVDKPGALAAFAEVLRRHGANVMYLAYDVDEAPGLAEMAMATASATEVSGLLGELNGLGYHYHVTWQGGEGAIDEVVGLNEVETFLFKLREVLPPDRLDALAELFRTSDDMRRILLDFRREAGGDDASLAASEVFTNILQFAATSLGKTGARFMPQLTGPLPLTDTVRMYMVACPTGANAYLLEHGDGYTLIDSGYGLYFPDMMPWLAARGFEPSRIKDALFTHPDADHAGWAAPLEEEFGTKLYMPALSRLVFEQENRAAGGDNRLHALNKAFTRLVGRITELRSPRTILPYPEDQGQEGEFPVIGRFMVGDLELKILGSLGGHIPAQVFIYAPAQGLLFCGDYLLDVASLSDRAKSTLSISRYLMTSTNNDSRLFGREMEHLKALMSGAQARLAASGRSAWVFPGHGEFYTVDEAGW